MEVHHHPDIRTKKLKEYFFEFIMIFLAVTLGFFAEQIRERVSEKRSAKDLTIAMAGDLKKDTAQLHQLLIGEQQWGGWVDSLITSIDTPFEKINVHNFYKYGFNVSLFQSLIFKRATGTVDQLKNSGYLRFFINTPLPNLLADYEAQIERLLDFEKLEFFWIDQYQAPFMLSHTKLKGIKQINESLENSFPSHPVLVNVNADTMSIYLNHLIALKTLNLQVCETLNTTLKKASTFLETIQDE